MCIPPCRFHPACIYFLWKLPVRVVGLEVIVTRFATANCILSYIIWYDLAYTVKTIDNWSTFAVTISTHMRHNTCLYTCRQQEKLEKKTPRQWVSTYNGCVKLLRFAYVRKPILNGDGRQPRPYEVTTKFILSYYVFVK